VARRVSSRRFVGREQQLAELRRLLHEAMDGHARIALVGGESGVGKTRLVDELLHHAKARGVRVLAGDCVELAEGELPYAPLIGALRPLIRADDPSLTAVRDAFNRSPGDIDAADQGRVFELLLDALDVLAQQAPLALVLEDIHWADRSTRDFLAFAARNLCKERVLLLATYRTDELHRRHPLRPLLPDLERQEEVTLVTLERLTRPELAELLSDILGAAPDDDLLDRLFARCEGNPLFAEELLAAGHDGHGDLPPTLRDALILRVEALPEATQGLLRVVAAAARADEALLAEVGELEPAVLRPALREALASNVLTLGEDGRYAFRHALLREAMHEDLLPGEDVELHLRLARALERRADAGQDDLDTVVEIAHHFAAAGEQAEALGAAVRAADEAERLRAPAEALAQLERALALWPRVPDARGRAGMDHARLLERLGTAADDLGDYERARHAFANALAELDSGEDPRRAARLMEALGSAQWHMGRGDETMATYDRGLMLLRDVDEPCVERAMLLAGKAKTLMLGGRYAEAIEVCDITLTEATASGSRAAEANARNTLGVALACNGDVEEGIAQLRESMAIDRADGRLELLGRGYTNLGDTLLLVGRAREAYDFVTAGIAESEGRGRKGSWMRLQAAEIAVALGRLDDADALLADHRGRRQNDTVGAYYGAISGELALARDHPEEALEHLQRASALVQMAYDPQWHGPLAAMTAHALRRLRRLDEARATLEQARLRLTRVPGMQDHARLARLAATVIAVEADVAERARDLGDADAVAAAVERAEAAVERARAEAGVLSAMGWVADAEAELTRARGESSPEAWARSRDAWLAMERFPYAAEALWRQGEAALRTGDREAAQALLAEGLAEAGELDMDWLIAEIEALARRARLRLSVAEEEAETEVVAAEADPGADLGLTPREREVLALLAGGATNREIGEALFMAEKTASVHVSRILAKLDVRSRTEAAAVAYRLGLVSAPAR
jgi:DNA-binding CsgD family transcriptional regulator/tetratricopeptide (TPR) repeat protein